jgi:dihydrolipoamide dehydrogenase
MIVVLGGGPAGRIASIRLASAGKEVHLIENGGIGGQCLHFGCMPVCALNDTARHIHSARIFHNMGITDTIPKINFSKIISEMHAIQEKIASILDAETKSAGVNIIYGKTGRLDSRNVFVGEEQLDAEAVIAATGSRPGIPALDGINLNGVYTSHTLFQMKELPEKIVIIGGNVMAAEFAYIFSMFGSKVTILSRSAFLKNADTHLRALAIRQLHEVEIREGTKINSLTGKERIESVHFQVHDKYESVDADAALIATGLIPRSDMLNGIKKGHLGEVIVDEYMRTSIPDVYACGDVVGPPYLTPIARHQGIVAADNILGIPRKMDYRFIPQSINLSQELAFCITEKEGLASLAIPGPAGPGTFWEVPASDTGLAKILFDPESGTIKGMCAAGPGGGLIAGYMSFLMKHHFSIHDFEEFIEVHPSTDGVYGIAKYASELMKRRNK